MKSLLRTCLVGLLTLLLLAGCAQPAATPQETTTPTVAAITSTLTLNASITPIPPPTRRLTSVGSATVTPATTIPPLLSYTPRPTSRFTKTTTPTITPTNTRFVRPPIGGRTWTPKDNSYSCSALTVAPEWGAVFKPRSDFVAKWKLTNNGTNMWHVDDIVFGFVRGDKLHNPNFQDKILPYTIYVGDKINLQIHMIPPKEPGTYNGVYGLRKTNKKEFFCIFDVLITVVRK